MNVRDALPSRRPTRLQGYDYSLPGDYFVTICVEGKKCVFGTVQQGVVGLSGPGQMACSVWDEMPTQYEGVELDTFVVMPNHLHSVIRLVGAGPRARPPLSLPDVIHRFKSLTTARYRKGVGEHGWPALAGRLWQRGYFDRIIRNREGWVST